MSSRAAIEIEDSIFGLVVSLCRLKENSQGKTPFQARNEVADWLEKVGDTLRVTEEEEQNTLDARLLKEY